MLGKVVPRWLRKTNFLQYHTTTKMIMALNIILLLILSANPYFRGLLDEFNSSNELPAFVEII